MSYLLLYILVYALPKVASLSQYIEMVGIGCGHNSMSNKIFLSHSASLLAAAKVINSDSMVEWEIHVCFFYAQKMASPPKVNIQSDVDLLSLTLLIQIASEQSSNTAGNSE